ncbi:MAG TPA: hypothetical protein VGK26_07170 [Thermoanaerobaculia bacterium]
MRALSILALVLVHAAAADAPAPIAADAVWTPPANFIETLHKACDGREGKAFTDCFIAAMQKAGAPPAAIAFARRVDGMGYLSGFEDAGRVDLAFAEYPFRANENQLCFLVNGEPPLLDVDDLTRLDRAALAANPDYAILSRKYPNLAIFPGKRYGGRSLRAVLLRDGGQGFAIPYRLHDGCHACRIVGDLELRWDFDVEGRFVRIGVQRVRSRPDR